MAWLSKTSVNGTYILTITAAVIRTLVLSSICIRRNNLKEEIQNVEANSNPRFNEIVLALFNYQLGYS
jgi:hypothetical protein